MIRIDLHTHSSESPDGGISAAQYKKMLDSGLLDYIAITDHNSIDFARELHAKLGDKIIIGEEIMTQSGEIIGLYLQEAIPPQLSLQETVGQIKAQGGLVYVPHPFEKTRSGVAISDLEKIAEEIDIIESVNGRAFAENHTSEAQRFATEYRLPVCASSDAHGASGWGRTYTGLPEAPDKTSLSSLLLSARIFYKKPTVRSLLYPKYNRIRKVLS